MSGSQRIIAVDSGPVHVVQITDTHLNRAAGGALLGLDTDFSLQQVLRIVREEQSRIDLVLGTGDISDHGSESAYQRAVDYFAQLSAPVLWLAGNHDRASSMVTALCEEGVWYSSAIAGNWQIIMLNSQIPGEVGGRLGAEELAYLESCLESGAASDLYSLICLHHQPVPMGSAWIDQQMVEDHEAFFSILDRFPAVRGVLWGHVHQQFDQMRGQVLLMSTPSSCVQFAPRSDDFKVDDQPPGYRWLKLSGDGSIDTGVSRVHGVTFAVDLESDGYL